MNSQGLSPAPLQIISAEHLLPIEGSMFSPGALAIQGDRILEIGSPESLRAQFSKAEVQHFADCTLMPGLVNAHSDLSLTEFAQYPHGPFEKENGEILFIPWLIQVSRFKKELPFPRQQSAIEAGLDIVKRSGTTTLADQCRYQVALPLYEKSGLRVLCFAEVENIQRSQSLEEFEQALALVDEILHQENPKITPGLAPFSGYTLSKNLLRILANHALQQQIPMQIHAALSFSEMEFFYDSLGEIPAILFKEAQWEEKVPPPHQMTPIQYLHELGVLRAKPSLGGCLHLGPTDLALIKNQSCTRIYTPLAFEYLQVGEVRWKQIHLENPDWAIGTMGKAAKASLNLWDEMRKILNSTETNLQKDFAPQILRAATWGGAKALQKENEIGSLKKNKQADFILVKTPQISENLEFDLILKTQVEDIIASYIAGERLF